MTDPNVSLRKIDVALKHLPPGYWPDPQHPASWTMTDYLLAQVIDEVRQLAWITAQVNSKRKVERPKPVWRPQTTGQSQSREDASRLSRSQRPPRPNEKKMSWWDLADVLAPGSIDKIKAESRAPKPHDPAEGLEDLLERMDETIEKGVNGDA